MLWTKRTKRDHQQRTDSRTQIARSVITLVLTEIAPCVFHVNNRYIAIFGPTHGYSLFRCLDHDHSKSQPPILVLKQRVAIAGVIFKP
ncbi:hypothetical protein CA13_09310 [Planctomycetes bacterium CA13]|uniref:Uncharacterized protein n=1 Tax=Novipirellula herctigrandis TaxID=2527986 RepID=A0A5C5YY83_9BACT|nr:hypothetical protein CA13_09310 [Planctomycetes bacterium CA13]